MPLPPRALANVAPSPVAGAPADLSTRSDACGEGRARGAGSRLDASPIRLRASLARLVVSPRLLPSPRLCAPRLPGLCAPRRPGLCAPRLLGRMGGCGPVGPHALALGETPVAHVPPTHPSLVSDAADAAGAPRTAAAGFPSPVRLPRGCCSASRGVDAALGRLPCAPPSAASTALEARCPPLLTEGSGSAMRAERGAPLPSSLAAAPPPRMLALPPSTPEP